MYCKITLELTENAGTWPEAKSVTWFSYCFFLFISIWAISSSGSCKNYKKKHTALGAETMGWTSTHCCNTHPDPSRPQPRDRPPLEHPDHHMVTSHPTKGRRSPRAKARSRAGVGLRGPGRATLPAPACTHRGHISFPLAGSHGTLGTPFPLGRGLLLREVAAKKQGAGGARRRGASPRARLMETSA